jgi:hypothetical protein
MALGVTQRARGVVRGPALRTALQPAHQLVEHEQRRVGQLRLEPDRSSRDGQKHAAWRL